MNFDYLDEVMRINQVVVNYPWKMYGLTASEAHDAWQESINAARKEQLQALGVESLGPWDLEKTKDYEQAMWKRLEDAKRRFLVIYARPKLPPLACQELEAKMKNDS